MTAIERASRAAAAILVRRVGIELETSEQGRLSRCLAAEAAARGLEPEEFVVRLHGEDDALQGLLDRVTVQETAFFRDPAQFEALASYVLPDLGDGLTIWSAGCSNGQEAYSLAMVLDELGFTRSRIIATDISTLAVGRTREARYSLEETKGLSMKRRQRYLRPVAGQLEVIPELRARVEVRHHNIAADPLPFAQGTCRVVLCRNVLIYFSRAEVKAFLGRLGAGLPLDAWLLLGYSESLQYGNEIFGLSLVGSAFVYRRRDRDQAKVAVPPSSSKTRKVARRPARSARTTRAEPRVRPRVEASPSIPPPDLTGFLAEGEAAVRAGDSASAIAAFRRCTYIDPAQPVAHLHLGLALEASGDVTAARRAYAAARAALDVCVPAAVEPTLEGYRIDELEHLLDTKLAVCR